MFVFPPLARLLTDLYGWRGCVLNLGGVYLNGVVTGKLMADQETTVKKCMTYVKAGPQTSPASEQGRPRTKSVVEVYATTQEPLIQSLQDVSLDSDCTSSEEEMPLKPLRTASFHVADEKFLSSSTTPLRLQLLKASVSKHPAFQEDVPKPETSSLKHPQPEHSPRSILKVKEASSEAASGDIPTELDQESNIPLAFTSVSSENILVREIDELMKPDLYDFPTIHITRDTSSMQLKSTETISANVDSPGSPNEHQDTSSASSSVSSIQASNWNCITGSLASIGSKDNSAFVSPLPMFLSPLPCQNCQESKEDFSCTRSLPALHVSAERVECKCKSEETRDESSNINLQIQDLCGLTENATQKSISKDGVNFIKSALRTLRDFLVESTDFTLLFDVSFVMFLIGSILNIFGYLVPVLFIPIRGTNELGKSLFHSVTYFIILPYCFLPYFKVILS